MQDTNMDSNEAAKPNEEEIPAPPEDYQNEVELELARLRQAEDELKDKYLRVLAETENLRKRLQKERQELIQHAIQNMIIDFLMPIDHFENALQFTNQASPEVKHWAVGFQMILNQFKDVLAANGVAAFTSIGQPFDHTRHEAIEMVETSEFPPGVVVEESLRGYTINKERILRPARVKVAKSPAGEDATTTNN